MTAGLKEARLQNPVLTNRNGIQRLNEMGKQAQLCEALSTNAHSVDAAGIGGRNMPLPGEI
ncbi:MAG TPA: hypothetical protein VGP47_03180, partial [Parachlamydiaceae bacterium]|nr:hypothetical protein [Parachlamydiaceae bacterium]